MNIYLDSLADYVEFTGEDSLLIEDVPFPDFTNIQTEASIMQMTPDEVDEWNRLETFAINDTLITREQLDSLLYGQNPIIYRVLPDIVTWTIAAAVIGLKAYRAYLCYFHAINVAKVYYPGEDGGGYYGNAFRHIYASMMARRYFGRYLAWALGEMYEIKGVIGGAPPRDTYMDKHNNKVGRADKYWTLRGHLVNDLYAKGVWAQNGKAFVDNLSNGEKQDWWSNPPTKKEAKKDEKKVSDKKYLYYQ